MDMLKPHMGYDDVIYLLRCNDLDSLMAEWSSLDYMVTCSNHVALVHFGKILRRGFRFYLFLSLLSFAHYACIHTHTDGLRMATACTV